MEILTAIEARLSRWLAYADTCLNAQTELPRCQGFWTFVAVVLGVVCVAAAGAVVAWVVVQWRRGGALLRGGKYQRPAR